MNTARAEVSRRELVKGSLTAAAGMAICGMGRTATAGEGHSAGEAAQLVDGTYVAKSRGFRGNVVVATTIADGSISEVHIDNDGEWPPFIFDKVDTTMARRIIDAQSFAVDVVSGATFTSMAVKDCVERCIEQAGGAGMFAEAGNDEEAVVEGDVEADVLVIGAGSAGCSAAYAAKSKDFDGVDSSLSVVMIEKLDFIGGSSCLSGGMFIAPVNLDGAPTAEDISGSIEAFGKRNTLGVNEALIEHELEVAGSTVLGLQKKGIGWVTEGPKLASDDAWYQGWKTINPPYEKIAFPMTWKGYVPFAVLEYLLPSIGVDVRLHTMATGLIVEQGEVVGAHVECRGCAYDIRAKKVILACGGISRSPELIERYAPECAGSIPFTSAGVTGDGLQWCVDQLGVPVLGYNINGNLGVDFRFGVGNDCTGWVSSPDSRFVMVNREGKRFAAEPVTYCHYDTRFLTTQTDAIAFVVVDADNPAVPTLKASVLYGDVIKCADTLEELAEVMGIDEASFIETVDAYNAAYDAGEGVEFDVANESMLPVRTAPFYAMALRSVHLGTNVSVPVDENCRVLDADGNAVPNVFAGGEMMYGGNVVTTHMGAYSISNGFYSGRIAGEAARDEIIG